MARSGRHLADKGVFEHQTGKKSAYMTEQERELMKRYGITSEEKTVYYYLGFRYDQLKDALNYAAIDRERREAVEESKD